MVVLTASATERGEGYGDEEAPAWGTAQDAASLLQQYFPAFFAEHLRSRPATLASGLGAACALFRLAELEHGLELRWPGASDYRGGPTLQDEIGSLPPAEYLAVFANAGEEYMSSVGYWLAQPRPVYYGWNVQSFLTGEAGVPGPLTALLWQLLSQTSLSVGRGDVIMEACREWDEEQRWDLLRIPPVPNVDADALLALVARDIPEAQGLANPALLLRYPLGSTDNPLADTGDVDVDVVHEGDDVEDWSWAGLAELGAQQQQARELAEAFVAWRDRVERGGITALRAVARSFHRAARMLANEPPPTLIDILVRSAPAELEEVAL